MNRRQAKKRRKKVRDYCINGIRDILDGRTLADPLGFVNYYDESSYRRSKWDWDSIWKALEKEEGKAMA